MGRGDKRTRKGKIWRSSFGNSRPASRKVNAQRAASQKG